MFAIFPSKTSAANDPWYQDTQDVSQNKRGSKEGWNSVGHENILWNTTISNRATHGWADWNISGNKHYGATQIHTETINLNGEEGLTGNGTNLVLPTKESVPPFKRARTTRKEEIATHRDGRISKPARAREEQRPSVEDPEERRRTTAGRNRAKGGFGGAGLDAPHHHQRGRRRAGEGEAGKRCQRAELERVGEPLGKPVLNLT
jgi:hypothetical protein